MIPLWFSAVGCVITYLYRGEILHGCALTMIHDIINAVNRSVLGLRMLKWLSADKTYMGSNCSATFNFCSKFTVNPFCYGVLNR